MATRLVLSRYLSLCVRLYLSASLPLCLSASLCAAVQLAPGSRTLKFQLQRARAFNRLMKHKLQVFRTNDGRGWGVSAVQTIPAGAFVCSYVGELLTSAEADRRSDSLY